MTRRLMVGAAHDFFCALTDISTLLRHAMFRLRSRMVQCTQTVQPGAHRRHLDVRSPPHVQRQPCKPGPLLRKHPGTNIA